MRVLQKFTVPSQSISRHVHLSRMSGGEGVAMPTLA